MQKRTKGCLLIGAGVAIFLECSSVDEAKAALAELPLVKAGLIDFEVIPLGAFTNWEILFAPAAK